MIILAKMEFGKYKIAVIFVLVILIVGVFVWKRSGEKLTPKRGKKELFSKKTTKPKAKPSNSAGANIEDDGDDKPTPRAPGTADDAKELFDLVHNDMASGMQIEAFEDAAGDLAGDDPSETFVNLKQKYTQAIDDNRDPMRSVTVKDYVQVLQKT